MRLAGTGDDAYVKAKIGRFCDLVQERTPQESAPDVLAALERCIRWHADYAPETDLGQRALRLRAAIRERPGYRFFAVVHGNFDDFATADAQLAGVVDEVVRSGAPAAFLESFLDAVGGPNLFGGGAHLLQTLALGDPTLGRRVLDAADTEPHRLHPFYAARLLVGIHLSGADPKLIRQFSDQSGWARATAVEACCRLRPGWHPGFRLGDEEFELLAKFARSEDPEDWQPIANFLWLIAADEPERVLGLAVSVVEHADDGWREGVGHVCAEVLKHRSDLREPVVALLDAFTLVPNLSDHWVEEGSRASAPSISTG